MPDSSRFQPLEPGEVGHTDHRTDGIHHAVINSSAGPRTGPRRGPACPDIPITVRNISDGALPISARDQTVFRPPQLKSVP